MSLPEDRSEWPTFFGSEDITEIRGPRSARGCGDGHPPPHILGYGSVGWGRHLAQQQQQGAGARTYALQPISLSLPNPSAHTVLQFARVGRGRRLYRLLRGCCVCGLL
jgi:hypothetical protein